VSPVICNKWTMSPNVYAKNRLTEGTYPEKNIG
jgi:hypothetical protein